MKKFYLTPVGEISDLVEDIKHIPKKEDDNYHESLGDLSLRMTGILYRGTPMLIVGVTLADYLISGPVNSEIIQSLHTSYVQTMQNLNPGFSAELTPELGFKYMRDVAYGTGIMYTSGTALSIWASTQSERYKRFATNVSKIVNATCEKIVGRPIDYMNSKIKNLRSRR